MTLPEESPPLLPSLDLELHTFPVDRYSKAHISVEGAMTLTSVTADTALFLLKTALAFVPGRACVVPDEQLAYAVIRVSHIVAPVAQLALEGDLVGAKQELQQLLPEFFSRSSAALKEIGLDCGAEFLKAIIGQPAVIVRLGVAYMTWVPVAIMDYFKYQGWPSYLSLVYEVSPAATPTRTQSQGHIAFISERDGKREIYKMKADGSEVTRLSFNEAIGWFLSWSPDGHWIAFESFRDGNSEIYKMRADGSEVTRLTFNEATDGFPIWSPDGNWVAFVSNRDGNEEIYHIYKMRADGFELTRLTFNEAFDWCPTWSPDGQWIAFESDRGGNLDIYKMRADGSELTGLTPDKAFEACPSWSPDGEWIAFRSTREGNSEIYKMRADGSEVTRLTFHEYYIGVQTWSPDGQWIAFESDRGPGVDVDIYKMRADGSEVTRLTYDEAYDGRPSWGP